MKVAVVGCGALGSFYGAKLCRRGAEVHFLLRSDYEAVRTKGVSIRSFEGDFHVQPRCARSPEAIGPSDLVLIGLKTSANDGFPRLLPPLVGPRTMVLTLQNGLGNEERLAKLFPPEQVMGGLAFVCLNRVEPGLIHHIDHGRIVIGEFGRPSEGRTHEIAQVFRDSGVACDVTENLALSHWDKLVWNIPFNGLGVASSAGYEALICGEVRSCPRSPCLTTDRLLAEPRWSQLVRELMAEVVHAAQKLGLPLGEKSIDEQIGRTLTMGAYKPSTVLDFERGQPLELQSMFAEPLRLARSAGADTPRLAALVRVLSILDSKTA
jgi:2-dehydropantoate 2-reductase